jgi:DNA anti-recombination protein RmuC
MKKTLTAVWLIIGALIFTVGCEKQQEASSDVRMHRLIAMENKQLKQQLQQETKKRDDEIKNLKNQLQAETKKRDDEIKKLKTELQNETKKLNDEIKNLNEQLARCEQNRDEKIDAEVKKLCGEQVSGLTEWNTELVNENEQLKSEIAKLKGETVEQQSDANN